MTKAYIDPAKCVHCSKCQAAKACPIKAIFRISVEEPNIEEASLCRGCGDCVASCFGKAIVLKES